MKRFGRKHRPFYRLCVLDSRTRRDGRVLEEVGTYDPMVRETDARARLNGERIDYWIGVGAQPSDKAAVLIKKYGTNGTHLELQKQAIEKLKSTRGSYVPAPPPPPPKPAAKPEQEEKAAEESAEVSSEESPAEQPESAENASQE